MNNKVYDVLKYVAQIVLPALATLYFMLAQVLKLPYSEDVTDVIVAIDAFLGTVLKISTNSYNKYLPEMENVAKQYEKRIADGEFDGVDYRKPGYASEEVEDED